MCSPQHPSLFTLRLVMKFHDRQSSERCIPKLISRHCLEKTRTRWNDFLFLITDDRDYQPTKPFSALWRMRTSRPKTTSCAWTCGKRTTWRPWKRFWHGIITKTWSLCWKPSTRCFSLTRTDVLICSRTRPEVHVPRPTRLLHCTGWDMQQR